MVTHLPYKEVRVIHQLSVFWRRFKRSFTAEIGVFIIVGFFMMAIFGPQISPHEYVKTNLNEQNRPPSPEHLFGTDGLGRDVLSGVIYGARISLFVGISAACISTVIGTIVGAISGYYGRIIDNLLMRFSDLFLVTPAYFLYILLIATLRTRSILYIMVILGVTMWPRLARIVRASFLSLKETDFVKAAKTLGASDRRIIFRHILPNAMAPIIVTTTFNLAGAILLESSLGFLGFGDPTAYSWGSMLERASEVIRFAWWQATFPGLAIFLTTLALNFVGDGLRDALDPRLRAL